MLPVEDSIRLYELNEFLRRTIALNFPALLWVRCEIAQLQESRGHFYLTLIEKQAEEDQIIAQSDGIIWQRDYRRMRRKMGRKLEHILQEGMEVLVQVKVDFHERFGLSLAIQDLDGDFTLGKVAAQRQQTIESLFEKGLLGANKDKELPVVLQRLAVISSATAAGFQDYVQHLDENKYGYYFHNVLFAAAMQGANTSQEIRNSLREIAERAEEFDAVLILRGGGAKLDLMAFDDLALNEAVAACPLPVLVGIGHEVDETVLDLVAHQSLKTPTAVADFLLEQNAFYEEEMVELGKMIQSLGQQKIQVQQLQLQQQEQIWRLESKGKIKTETRMLDYLAQSLPGIVRRRLSKEERQIASLAQHIHLLSPEECLRRGYSITLYEGKALGPDTPLAEGAIIETRLHQRKIESKVTKYGKG